MSQLKLTEFAFFEPEPTPQPAIIQTEPQPRTQTITLRPYQEEAYEAWLMKGRRGIIIAPTGTGKTVIACHAIMAANTPTLIITPRERILKMWQESLKVKFNLEATAFYDREKVLSNLTISIYNSVVLHPWILDHFKMVILDEVHHVAAETFSQILFRLEGKDVMALTATLKREDGRHNEVAARLPVVYCLDLATAIKNGYVSPIEIYPVSAPLTEVESRLYRDVEHKIMRVRSELEAAKATGSSNTRWLETQLKKLLNRRRQLLSRIPSKKKKVLELVKGCKEDRVIVFSESIDSIEELKNYLTENGVSAETYHSGKPERVRDAIFAGWGKAFKVLLAVRALDEGIDVPEVATGIIIASGKSTRQLVQRQGRLMRPVEGKTAKLYVVYAESTYEYGIFLKLKGIIKGWVRVY
jgi:superfamily II DNA or RNA helicase